MQSFSVAVLYLPILSDRASSPAENSEFAEFNLLEELSCGKFPP
jgi:hypothetical protein